MMRKFFNANAVHNYLNVCILLLTSLAGYDWTMLGVEPELALQITGALTLAKILINVGRDGISGLTKVQPPVEQD